MTEFVDGYSRREKHGIKCERDRWVPGQGHEEALKLPSEHALGAEEHAETEDVPSNLSERDHPSVGKDSKWVGPGGGSPETNASFGCESGGAGEPGRLKRRPC